MVSSRGNRAIRAAGAFSVVALMAIARMRGASSAVKASKSLASAAMCRLNAAARASTIRAFFGPSSRTSAFSPAILFTPRIGLAAPSLACTFIVESQAWRGIRGFGRRCGRSSGRASKIHHFAARGARELGMAQNTQRVGWIGMGRMGYPMAERLLKAGYDVSIWNRTRSKAEPLAKIGGKVVDKLSDLSGMDVVFSIVAEGKDVEQVYLGKDGVLSGNKTPGVFVDCSTISVEESADIRKRLTERGAAYVCAPVSGNAKVIKAGKLSSVCSGPEASFRKVEEMIKVYAPKGVSYVGEGELARVCKIAHNVMLGVVIQNLIEITLLVNKMGVPRHAFLAFLNNGVMGSMFTRYKAPALVNLDWTTTFTPELLRKDLDLGLELGREMDVPMPVTAATREMLQTHFGAATLQKNPEEYLQKDFAALMETMALMAGMKLEPENKPVPTGLEH